MALAGAHREADRVTLVKCKVVEQGVQVGGEGVVVVTRRGLTRQAEAAPVVVDRAVARRKQLALLALPGAPVQRIAVNQHDGAAAAVIFVVDLDVGAVLDTNFGTCHSALLSCRFVRSQVRGAATPNTRTATRSVVMSSLRYGSRNAGSAARTASDSARHVAETQGSSTGSGH